MAASFSHHTISRHEYLGQRSFMLTMCAAFLLHVMALYILHLMPGTKVVNVPVRTLNIKLGSGDAAEEPSLDAPVIAAEVPANAVSHTVRDDTPDTQARTKALNEAMAKMLATENKPKPVTETASNALDKLMGVEKAKPKPKEPPKKISREQDKGPIDVRKEGTNVAAPTTPVSTAPLDAPVNYVRPSVPQAVPQGDGSAIGNSTENSAVTRISYDQLVKLWIEKFKTKITVPTDAPAIPQAIIHIRIDRRGNIVSIMLDQSSGYASLDEEAADMARRANPVPPAPDDYSPGEDSFEFKIPIIFK